MPRTEDGHLVVVKQDFAQPQHGVMSSFDATLVARIVIGILFVDRVRPVALTAVAPSLISIA